MRYAQVEIDSGNRDRARSVFERALAVDYTYVPLWLRYSQMEILLRQFSHARAVLDRSVTLLPHEQKLWLTYIEMEELLDNLDASRQLFERWTLTGSSVAWQTWYRFEKVNHGNRMEVLERWVAHSPGDLQMWFLLAQETDDRSAYSRAIDTGMLNDSDRRALLKRWASYESSKGEDARAKALLELGGISAHSQVFVELPYVDVDSWWAEISLRSKSLDTHELTTMFETAVSRCVPPDSTQKTTEWRKYALLWLRFVVHLEKNKISADKAYHDGLLRWPHKNFTSATLWKAYAEYQVRQNNVARARKIYGSALGQTKRNSHIFRDYIALEKKLLATDKVRLLYSKFCEECCSDVDAWKEYASFEDSLHEAERARGIFRTALYVATSIGNVDSLWIAWAEMEADNGDFDAARDVWNEAVKHNKVVDVVNVWVRFAMFEVSTGWGEDDDEVDSEAVSRARSVFTRALNDLRQLKTERLHLFDLFIQFEEDYGSVETLDALKDQAPHAVTRTNNDGEAYIEYEFPEAQSSAVSKLLANARRWAQTNATR